eukprot:11394799-Ditylum_brightwellii.AAC.1
MSKQNSLTEFYPAKKTGIESLGPTHRWNTSPPVPDTNSVCNLMEGIDLGGKEHFKYHYYGAV